MCPHGGRDARRQPWQPGVGQCRRAHRRRADHDPAAVDAARDLLLRHAAGLGHRPDAELLGRMLWLLVARHVPAALHAGGEHAGVVAGAVVPGFELAVAAQVCLGEADVCQHAPYQAGVQVRPPVRGADDRQLLVAPAEVLDGAAVHPGPSLERLGGRAPIRPKARVAVARHLAAGVVDDAGDQMMATFDRWPPSMHRRLSVRNSASCAPQASSAGQRRRRTNSHAASATTATAATRKPTIVPVKPWVMAMTPGSRPT